ncbi:MAG TPA: cation:proton antiporter, partial [Polyangiaceae bacterium]
MTSSRNSSPPERESGPAPSPPDDNGRIGLKSILVYLALFGLAVGMFFLIRAKGETLVAPAAQAITAVPAPRAPVDVLKHVLLALGVVMAASHALGAVFRLVRQPPVIGEVIAGILLGPSLLGRVAPNAQAWLLPREIVPYLGVIAQVGVILFMFLVGLELDTRLLRKRSSATVAISHASIVVPFVLGSMLALWLYPELS